VFYGVQSVIIRGGVALAFAFTDLDTAMALRPRCGGLNIAD
jgi:hypothetical protein